MSGCTGNDREISVKEKAKEACIRECINRLDLEMNLSNGPCLSDEDFNWMIEDWVCDVAHSPRQQVDNDPANQCPEFGKTASHFVEVDPECNFIKEV